MKTIPLKTVSIRFPTGDHDKHYAELIRGCIEHVDPKAGLKLEDMRKRTRVLDALDKADGATFDLEDADAEILLGCVEAMPWAMVSQGIVQFCDDVRTACGR